MLGWPCKSQEQNERCNVRSDQDKEQFQKNLANNQSTCDDFIYPVKVNILRT